MAFFCTKSHLNWPPVKCNSSDGQSSNNKWTKETARQINSLSSSHYQVTLTLSLSRYFLITLRVQRDKSLMRQEARRQEKTVSLQQVVDALSLSRSPTLLYLTAETILTILSALLVTWSVLNGESLRTSHVPRHSIITLSSQYNSRRTEITHQLRLEVNKMHRTHSKHSQALSVPASIGTIEDI